MNSSEIKQVRKLIINTKNNLKYVSELDKEIRYAKYLIDNAKSEKFDELLEECEIYQMKKTSSN